MHEGILIWLSNNTESLHLYQQIHFNVNHKPTGDKHWWPSRQQ